MIRKIMLTLCVLVAVASTPADAGAPRFKARLCNSCAFGSQKENCVKCGKWAPSNYSPAGLCSNCGFGSKVQNCVKCGKWAPSNYTDARICSNCAFGNKKENCVKCGKWAN